MPTPAGADNMAMLMSSTGHGRPRIGLTTYREQARWGVWDEPADLLPVNYATAVQDAGGVSLLLPPSDPTSADVVIDGVHGLVLSGGADVDPRRYRATRAVTTGAARADRDEWETTLLHAALLRDLPVLAVCRGMQVLNVALGGDLLQHLPDVIGTDVHCPTIGGYGRHVVDLAAEARLARILNARIEVATHHHQGVGRLGVGLVAVGWAEDRIVEAVELPEHAWVFGVQWHPESFDGAALFNAFVQACRTYRLLSQEEMS